MELKLDKIVLHLPEKWQYEKIVELVGWYDNKIKLDYWDEYKKDFAVKINNNKIQEFCTWRFYQDYFASYKYIEYSEFMAEFFPEILKEVNPLALKKSQIKKEIEVLTKIEIILLNETDNKIRPLYDSVSILEPVRKQIIQLENIYFLLEDIEK